MQLYYITKKDASKIRNPSPEKKLSNNNKQARKEGISLPKTTMRIEKIMIDPINFH